MQGKLTSLHPAREWQVIVEQTPPAIRQLVAALIGDNKAALAARFYDEMLIDGEAGSFLNHQMVSTRLHGTMQRWLSEVFTPGEVDVDAAVERQRKVGEVHARIQLPIHLVTRSARLYKRWISDLLVQSPLERADLLVAYQYVGDLMDLAIEVMSSAFVQNSDRAARAEEGYRLFSLGQNISLERERQRGALLEWAQRLLFALHRRIAGGELPRLGASEFGLWLHHKAQVMFEGSAEIGQIVIGVAKIDQDILPRLADDNGDAEQLGILAQHLQNEVDHLKFLLNALFDRYVEIENGRDSLTRLLSRRFLAPVLNREISLQKTSESGFALLLIDIDHFKGINDTYGHQSGDKVLQQTANLIISNVRSGDFIFRYGGEEILVVLVEVLPEGAARVAEKIRASFEQTPFLLADDTPHKVTVSVGVAAYDGHPDYEYLIGRADKALYEAKEGGRNRCVTA